MEKVLLQGKKFVGKYVALRSASDKTVIADGDDPSTVRKLTSQKGVTDPIIFFVSESENDVKPCYWIDDMDIVDYPFIKAGEAESRPALFIRLVHPSTGSSQETTGLIDTGASVCCIPMGYAEILGLAPKAGVKRTVRTANGTATGYEDYCAIKVWNTHEFFKGNKVQAYELSNIPVLFMPDLKDVLLGVSFMNEKVLAIDYHRKIFSLHET